MIVSSSEVDGFPQLYLWVAVDSPDRPPGRIEVEACVVCGALVPSVRADTHTRWHAERDPSSAEVSRLLEDNGRTERMDSCDLSLDTETVECPACHGACGYRGDAEDTRDGPWVACPRCDGQGELTRWAR